MKKRIISLVLVFVMVMSAVLSIPGISNVFAEASAVSGETDPSDPDNIAYGKPTRSNSTTGNHELTVNGKTTDRWTGAEFPKYVDVDLLDNYDISKITLFIPTDVTYAYTIYGSLDGVSFTRIFKSDGYVKFTAKGVEHLFDETLNYRIIRVNIDSVTGGANRAAAINEIKIYGKKNNTAVIPTRDEIKFTSYEEWLKDYCGFDVSTIADIDGNYDIDKTYTESDTVSELNGIVTRLLGSEYVSWFTFDVAPNTKGKEKSYFLIEDADGKIKISGSDGCDIAAGLNWYLKYYCKVSVTQETEQTNMPEAIVKVGTAVFMETSVSVRYAYNYCTLSYTMPFYGYDDWRRELDWLYLQGVNLILDITATEALWVNYLQTLGYSADDAKNFVCGYSYKAWWLMGNIENFGGTVSDAWIVDTLEMARVNQRSMTVMGATPALQTYVGAMPETFGELGKEHLLSLGYSDVSASLAPQGQWCGSVRPNVLRTDYDGYGYLAKTFYDCQDYLYGQVADYYCGDVCHEGGIVPAGLKKEDMALRILQELLKSDENGIWILQRWWDNPLPETLNGFGEYRTTNVIVIDLSSAQNAAKWQDTTYYGSKEFGKTTWIFSTLDNYGGRATMHSNLKVICGNIVAAKNGAKYMTGMGITPEGTQNNPILYEIYWEMVWRDEVPDLEEWTNDYIERRYGKEDKNLQNCWKNILGSIYSVNTADGTSVNTVIGTISKFDYAGGYYVASYSNIKVNTALQSMMASFDDFCDNECYIYDLVELLQTYLADSAALYLGNMRTCAEKPSDENYEKFKVYKDKFLDCILLINEVSAYSENQLVGNWIGNATDWISDERNGDYDDYDVDNMTFNAKALISSWFTTGNLIDYANRLFNGLVADYYYKSWVNFLNGVDKLLQQNKACSTNSTSSATHLAFALNFIVDDVDYRTGIANPKGDAQSRGLKAIYNHIACNHNPMLPKNSALKSIGLNDKAEYTITDGILNGITDKTTVQNVLAALTYPDGGEIKFYSPDGTLLDESKTVSTGCTIKLSSGGSANADLLVIGSVVYASDEDVQRAAEIKTQLSEFIAYAKTLDTSSFNKQLVARINAAVEEATEVTSGNLSYGVEALEEVLKTVNSVKSSINAVLPTETPAVSETPTAEPDATATETQSGDNSGSNVIIYIIIAAAVVVIAGVCFFIIKSKKKK